MHRDNLETHFTLQRARVDEKYTISPEEHLSTFDGLNTTKKLEMLHEQKGLPKDKFNQVWKDKQESTSNTKIDIRTSKQNL